MVSRLFQSALRFAVASDLAALPNWVLIVGFQSALRFAVVSDGRHASRPSNDHLVSIRFKVRGGFRLMGEIAIAALLVVSIRFKVRGGFRHRHHGGYVWPLFQSALRFAVVSDPTPRHAVLTSPVAVVLHTTPPHPLQPGDRTCPKWGKTPSQVPYTPEAVFGRSPTPLPEGVSKMPSRRELGVFVGFYLGPGPVPRRGIRPRARSGLLFGRR